MKEKGILWALHMAHMHACSGARNGQDEHLTATSPLNSCARVKGVLSVFSHMASLSTWTVVTGICSPHCSVKMRSHEEPGCLQLSIPEDRPK